MEDKLYWLWLSLKLITPLDQFRLVSLLGTPKEIYNTTDFDPVTIPAEYIGLLLDKSLADAEKAYNETLAMDGYILTYADAEYPDTLRQIPVPPLVLYCKGRHLNWNASFKVTVVGTRKYSDYGLRATTKIVRELVGYDTLIVTGMARGIDAIANCAAIRAGGRTAAVLGSGLDVIYPSEYKGLYNAITRVGTVLTEFPPGTRPLRQNFPRRNRIMAGLCEGVLVGQAPIKSGALITAAHAINNGIETFAIPSRLDDEGFAGSNSLISQGAKLAVCAEDIIESFTYLRFKQRAIAREERAAEEQHPPKEEKRTIDTEGLSDTEKKIVGFLCNGKLHVDDLARLAGMTSQDINSVLVMLELSGIVKKLNGNVYSVI